MLSLDLLELALEIFMSLVKKRSIKEALLLTLIILAVIQLYDLLKLEKGVNNG